MATRKLDRCTKSVMAPGLAACIGALAACGTESASSHAPALADGAGTGDAAHLHDGGADDSADPDDGGIPPGSDAAPPSDGPSIPDGAAGPLACGFTACASGDPCPDLAVDRDDLLSSIVIDTRNFTATDCALDEGCIGAPGMRRLLRFDTATENIGTADLEVGNPTSNACFTFSQCHQHYHFKGVGKYTLYKADGTTVAAVGHKQGFCLEDVRTIPSLNPPPAQAATPFTCTDQGLHIGYEDIYTNDLDCQWIDITGLPSGQYVLSVAINPSEYLPESNYGNNEEHVPVTIPPP
jgi:hypothetical protein